VTAKTPRRPAEKRPTANGKRKETRSATSGSFETGAGTSRRKRERPRSGCQTQRTSNLLPAFYDALLAAWGPQHWWPGETPFEVMVGAILTQNTNWTNVEKAIGNLKAAGVLEPHALLALSHERLAELLRPSGYFNVKARRLRSFMEFFVRDTDGDEGLWSNVPTPELRERLLAVNGVGRETVDSILLYALDREIFVIDAYTRRVLTRHGLIDGDEDYDDLRALFETNLPRDRALYNEYHALIVRTGKYHCKPTATCEGCPLTDFPHTGLS
jgi:endonuclease-3 related protein